MTLSKSYFLLKKHINFNKNEMKSKIEDLTQTFRDINFAAQLI